MFLIEVDVFLFGNALAGLGVDVKEVFDDAVADEVLFDDAADVADFDRAVKGVLRVDLDEGALGAKAEATDVIGDGILRSTGRVLLEFLWSGWRCNPCLRR